MTTEEDLLEAIRTVREAGLDPDSPGGAAALAFLLRDRSAEAELPSTTGSDGSISETSETALGKVAKWIGDVQEDALADRLDFDDAEGATPSIPSTRLGKGKADRQRTLALLKLAADRKGLGVEEVPVSQINALADEYSALDQNLPHNVAKRGELIARRGKRGAYSYRITRMGLERARELFQALVNEDEGELRV